MYHKKIIPTLLSMAAQCCLQMLEVNVHLAKRDLILVSIIRQMFIDSTITF